jgi:hypothetical protein
MSTGNQLKIVVPEWIIRQQNWVHVEYKASMEERGGGGVEELHSLCFTGILNHRFELPGKQPDTVNHHILELGKFLKAKKEYDAPCLGSLYPSDTIFESF